MRIVCANLAESAVQYLQDQKLPVEPVDEEEFNIEDWSDPSQFGVIVVNLDVSGGLYICRALRRANKRIPVIGIAASSAEYSFSEMRAIFLENGGDDLFTATFNPRELVASIRALMRRSNPGEMSDILNLMLTDNLRLRVNQNLGTISINGNPLHFTGKEYQVMLQLVQRANQLVTKDQIINNLYSFYSAKEVPEIKIVDVFICKLRKKLAPYCGDIDVIKTSWGRGYGIEGKLSGERHEPSAAA